MNKEIKDRLDKLENELNESKNEIHNLKSSVSLTIERGIRKLLSRFTRKQLILGSVIALFSISIIGIAGTVTKTYTFSSGEVVSASKFNTNFDTLFTLVNGNLDDSNISGISGSKITSGTIDGAQIDNVSSTAINYDGVFIFTTFHDSDFATSPGTNTINGDWEGGGRNSVDTICSNWSFRVPKNLNSCSNIRALISISDSDEVRDMISNYSVPDNKPVYNDLGNIIADNFTHLISGNNLYNSISGTEEKYFDGTTDSYWTGTTTGGALSNYYCSGWSSTGGSGTAHLLNDYYLGADNVVGCQNQRPLICLCF